MKPLRKICTIIMMACFLCGIFISEIHVIPTEMAFAAASVKLSKTKLTLNAGYTKQLKVSGAKEKAVRWSTSARAVASVSENGLVRGEGQGSAKIYAKVGNKKLTCKVTVKDPAIAIKKQIEQEKNERIAEILADTTQVDVTGTKYYVSSSEGNDDNDGLSPEHPWKTAAKACDGTVKSGDGVYFKRGDVWRDDMFREESAENIVFSAYGTGDNPFDVKKLDNHATFTYINLTEYQKEDYNWNGDKTILQVENAGQGDFYMRCDEGNPGTVFSSIEFCMGEGVAVCGGSTVNNICVKYIGYQGIQQLPGYSNGIRVQNCEVAYCGSGFIGFNASEQDGMTGGEGTGCSGRGGRIIGNYIHNGSEGGMTLEDGWNGSFDEKAKNQGDALVSGNVFEDNNGGVGIMSFLDSDGGLMFSDIQIVDNIFYKTMYIDKMYNVMSGEGAQIKLGFWHTGDKSYVKNIRIENNTFAFGAPHIVELGWTKGADIHFQGNTYLQGRYHDIVDYQTEDGVENAIYAAESPAAAKKALQFIGDTTGKVYTYYTGLEGIDVKRAKEMGFISASQKKTPEAQLTEKQWVSILTKSLNKIDADVAKKFKKDKSYASSKKMVIRCL